MTLRIPSWLGHSTAPKDFGADWDDGARDLLLAPGSLGGLTLRNRVVLPAMETNLAELDGTVGPRLIAYYRARARGGTALIITENTSVHPSGRVTRQMLRLESDHDGHCFGPLVEAVHAEGARIFVQLSHAGRQTLADTVGGPPWAPSELPCPMMKEVPRVMTEADIHTLIDAFAAAAARAHRAGADGVELHMAHGYLLCGFLSPDQNRREDSWGGDLERRLAFPRAVVRAIRARCGQDFAIQARLSADEFVEGGITPEDCEVVVKQLVEDGVGSVSISGCNYESMHWNIPSYFLPEGTFVPLARRIRQTTRVPVIAVGRLHRPAAAARALREGSADFVAIGRGQIADPDYVAHLRAGTVRPCFACNRCIASINGSLLECAVNADVGFEDEPLDSRWAGRRVLVVGGGPAGLDAALRAHRLGASVVVVEKRPCLGGQLDLASMPGGKEPVLWYLRWWQERIVEAGIEVRLGRELRPSDLQGVDDVIWAAGSWPVDRRIDGDSAVPHLPLDLVMRDPRLAGLRPLVLGGGAGGAEAAHLLATHGARPVVVEMKRRLARDLAASVRFHLEKELQREGVEAYTNVVSLRLDGDGLSVGLKAGPAPQIAGITSVVLAAGRAPVPLPAFLQDQSLPIHVLGDALRPGSVAEALQGAASLFRRPRVSSATRSAAAPGP